MKNEDPDMPTNPDEHVAGSEKEKQNPLEQDHSISSPATSRKGDTFTPLPISSTEIADSSLPPELWTLIQSSPANFTPHYFLEVSRNMLENPNLTASHLSRAELSYQSFTDATFNPEARHPHELAGIVKHMKAEHQPRLLEGGVEGYALQWTVVRVLVPRNPKLDSRLVQTCHLFVSTQNITIQEPAESRVVKAERYMIIYIPHVDSPDEIPFYHPKVRRLAILYTFRADAPPDSPLGNLSIYYDLFPSYALDNRLGRTALKMLEIVHKHARGRMAGYKKRVHHDVVIAQKPFQDTYAYLKGKYAKRLIEGWVEQTPAEKHVFEDLGIAAFLVELWTEMYAGKGKEAVSTEIDEGEEAQMKRRKTAQSNFPGFVDIGCGNGLLVYLLNEEGWRGWGFDARCRKTWSTFPAPYAEKLEEMLLVPSILDPSPPPSTQDIEATGLEPSAQRPPSTHPGVFPQGTFLIANHADELTIWTPLLAFLSTSQFLAIPCCSHNFAGERFRAPNRASLSPSPNVPSSTPPTKPNPKPPSAFATFCTYTHHISTLFNFVAEKEHLRIPSTRNVAILGRQMKEAVEGQTQQEKMYFAKSIVEKEMRVPISEVRRLWVERGTGLMKPGKGGGH